MLEQFNIDLMFVCNMVGDFSLENESKARPENTVNNEVVKNIIEKNPHKQDVEIILIKYTTFWKYYVWLKFHL